MLSRIFPS